MLSFDSRALSLRSNIPWTSPVDQGIYTSVGCCPMPPTATQGVSAHYMLVS